MSKKKSSIEELEYDAKLLEIEIRGLVGATAQNAIQRKRLQAERGDLRFRYARAISEYISASMKLEQLRSKKKPVARRR